MCEAVERAERGIVDADLGGGLIKQRIARSGQGRSGGFRAIIGLRRQTRAVLLFGFAKKDLDNIEPDELASLRKLAANWLFADSQTIRDAVEEGKLREIEL